MKEKKEKKKIHPLFIILCSLSTQESLNRPILAGTEKMRLICSMQQLEQMQQTFETLKMPQK